MRPLILAGLLALTACGGVSMLETSPTTYMARINVHGESGQALLDGATAHCARLGLIPRLRRAWTAGPHETRIYECATPPTPAR
jgi:hypothetical protein